MKKNSQSSLFRLNTILTLFQARGGRYSIKELAELLDVPAAVIRKDILILYKNKEFGTTFYPIDDEDMPDFSEQLEAGKLDEVILGADTIYQNNVFLSLTQMELSCLEEFLGSDEMQDFTLYKNYVTKPMYNQSRSNMQVKVQEMNDLIQDGKCIRITYKDNKKGMMFRVIRPLELVHDAMEDLYYVVTIEDGKIISFRLDRIRNYEVSTKTVDIPDLSPLDRLVNMWGLEDGEQIHVRLKILKMANVREKVHRDLAARKNGKWDEDEEALYFEDDVIGVSRFKNWVLSYGSSIIVMEPRSLQQEILADAMKRMGYYE